MTRDEAIKTLNRTVKWSMPNGQFVDAFVALGMLKLEEPKSANKKFEDMLIAMGWRSDAPSLLDVFSALNSANLKIVEK